MSEEKEPSQDKESKLKLKLKKMGVMREEGAEAGQQTHSFWHGKSPVIIVIFIAVVFGWWYSNKPQSYQHGVADNSSTQVPSGHYPPEYGYGPPPMPRDNQANSDTAQVDNMPGWRRPGNRYGPPPGWRQGPPDNQANSDSAQADNVPGWRGPGNRYDDRYGPPPGWRPAYPPPPAYYGHPYYGPPPPAYYPNPYYRGYNGYHRPPPQQDYQQSK